MRLCLPPLSIWADSLHLGAPSATGPFRNKVTFQRNKLKCPSLQLFRIN